MDYIMEIRELDQSWKGKNFLFRYTTNHHYRVSISHTPGQIHIQLQRETLSEPIVKSFESSLYSHWLVNPKVFGAFEGTNCSVLLNCQRKTGTIVCGSPTFG